jgi:tetratricopeptide (TPR) repeat protein
MARQFGEQAVEAARGLGDDRLLSTALAELGSTHFFAGEPDLGLPFGQEAVERARLLGDDVLLAATLLLYLQVIGPAASGQLFAEAIACTERSGDHLTNCWLHNDAGYVALAAGDLPAARAHLDAAAHAGQQIGFENTTVPENLGLVLRAEGDPDGARAAFGAGLRISRRNGDNSGMAYSILGLACVAGDAGDWDRAAVLHGAAQAFLDRAGTRWQEVEARYRRDSLAQVRAHLGDEQLEGAYAQGIALGLDQALDLALRTVRSS